MYEILCHKCNKIGSFEFRNPATLGPGDTVRIHHTCCKIVVEVYIPFYIPEKQSLKYFRQYLVKDALENYDYKRAKEEIDGEESRSRACST